MNNYPVIDSSYLFWTDYENKAILVELNHTVLIWTYMTNMIKLVLLLVVATSTLYFEENKMTQEKSVSKAFTAIQNIIIKKLSTK